MIATVQNARAALAAKEAAEASIARMSLCPPWRHAAFAGIMAALVIDPAVPLPWRFAVIVAAFAGIALVVRSDRRRLGMFINGYRRGRTRLVTFPMLAVVMLLYGLSVYAALDWHRPNLSVAFAVIAFLICYGGSVLWPRVFVRELRG